MGNKTIRRKQLYNNQKQSIMNNQLQTTTISDVMHIAKAFSESGMFPDIKSVAQAAVKIQCGKELGIPPFAAMSGIHIIQGKPTIGAGVMAAMVKASGKYNYRVTEQTDKVCSIDYYEGAEMIGTSTFTIEDAKKAGTKNTDKFPRNMLFARAMSNGVKWYTPDVFAGPVYVPEEMEFPMIQEPTKRILTDEQFQSAIVKIKDGECIKGSTVTVYDWVKTECQLTEAQQSTFNLLNTTDNGTD
jgi:hypothetical protein